MKKIIYILISFVALSCNRKLEIVNPDANLYPIIDGKYRIYQVTDTTFTNQDTLVLNFNKKELTNSSELDLNNRSVSRLEIHKSDSLGNFNFFELWTQFKDNFQAERIEGNTKYIVLNFPVLQNKSWDGNQFNNLGATGYQYLNTDTTITLNGIKFEHCVYIQQRKVTNSILSDILTYEIYAPGIGKIKRYDRYFKIIYKGSIKTLDTDSYFHEETLLSHNY